ncbi:MAG: DUF4143 domain-containing protein [Planctomycetes bacterium]|nr:DUF4143 domain-containing protein [Planctomycetota bacterium]
MARPRWRRCCSLGGDELYYAYLLRPWRKRATRSLRQAAKLYLWDWSEAPDRAKRFENLVAGRLLKAYHTWTDAGEGDFELHYLRSEEKQETDFLVVRDGKPWLPVEARLGDTAPSPHWRALLPLLGCPRAVQVVAPPSRFERHQAGDSEVLVTSATHVLACLV